jgi:hypothetical protein
MPAEHLTSVYENGWQAVFPVYGNGCATMSYSLSNCVLRFMKMAGKQFSPFMEMVVQPCLTACATMFYSLCNCVLRFMEMAGKQFSPFMEMVVQPCLTACATASYGLWKWLASSSPIYGNGFRSGTSENQRLHKKLGNSENRVTYRFR